MKTEEQSMWKTLPCISIDGEIREKTTHEVIEELPVALFINGRHAMTAMMSPVGFEDFVTGYLFTEQIIKAAEEIESIKIDRNRISVITKNLFSATGQKRTILSGCGGSSSYIDQEKLPKITSGFNVPVERIRTLVHEVLTSDLHVRTGGIHLVGLAGADGLIARSEDIGRHNALDRVIGYGLRTGIDFSQTCVISSGRISSEMVRKCLVANIPVIISRGATTTLAVEIATTGGICIIGFARASRMRVYTHAGRVEGPGMLDPSPARMKKG
jgi:FdhD protein